MKIKKGDWVLCVEGKITENLFKNNFYKVKKIERQGNEIFSYLNGNFRFSFYINRFIKVLIDNPLNRKLYPKRIEYKGFLIPEKFAKQLKAKE